MKLDSIPITLSGCAKTFRGTRVLEPLDLTIGAGETLVLLGPSGCGKTTTLRVIAGLETPDAGGRVIFGDEDVTALPIERRKVGMVFQNYALFPNLSVSGNIGYGLKIQRVPAAAARERVGELLAMMRLEAHADKPVTQLSGGQRQRVAVARALIKNAPIILLDEATAALDSESEKQVQEAIEHLCQNRTTIVIAHRLHTIMHADTILVVEAGEIVERGRHDELLRRGGRYASFFRLQQRDAGSGEPVLAYSARS
jgi:putative spermidine/putrescine transport system ATP-binding protein